MTRIELEECTFEECTFKECTPWAGVFHGTLIDPSAFLEGFAIPPEHLTQFGPAERLGHLRDQKRSSVVLAEQLLRSNEERRHALFADAALYGSRKAAIVWRFHELESTNGFSWLVEGASLILDLIYLQLTSGGTSLRRLLGLAAAVIFAFGAVFHAGVFGLTIRSVLAQDLTLLECVSATASLFLAFGYTNFAASGGVASAVLVSIPIGGLGWSAIFLAVIVRRAYR